MSLLHRLLLTLLCVSSLGTAARADETAGAVDESAVDDRGEETPGPIYFEDLGGQTKSGVPRVIRDIHGTEVFFAGLADGYMIAKDNSHNAFFAAIAKAMKENKPISFRVEPLSRQILAVDGVKGATALPKPKSADATASVDGEEAGTAEKKRGKRRRKAIDPRKATTTTGWVD